MKMEMWVLYAFVAMAGFVGVNFTFRFISHNSPILMTFVIYGSATLATLFILLPTEGISFAPKSFAIASLIGVFSLIGTIFALKSIGLSPNPGYSVAIYSSGVILFVTLLSALVFKAPLTLQKIAGIFATMIGLVLLSI